MLAKNFIWTILLRLTRPLCLGFLQSVKAVCAKLGGIETTDLAEALDNFSQACVRFDKAKGNEDPAGRLRPEIVEVSSRL